MQNIRQWLNSLDLGQYVDAFESNDIDWGVLPELDHDALKDIGVASTGHRLRILKAVKFLQREHEASSFEFAPVEHSRDALPASTGEAERRQLTVMFCDLVGSVELGQQMDMEDYRDLLARFRDAVVRAVQRFDGFVARHQGDGLLVYFGYPQAHENDVERAVKVGLAIVREIGALDSSQGEEPKVRVGIATGPTVVGDLLDTGGASEVAALGATPNLAARLQSAAVPNSVVVSATTKRLVADKFLFEPTPPLSLKGIAETVVAYIALGETSELQIETTADSVTHAALIGREAELALLLDRWKKAAQGAGQGVLVSAEPGVGKTRLIAELKRYVQQVRGRMIELQCSPYDAGTSFHPVVDAMQRTVASRRARSTANGIDELVSWIDELGVDVASIVPLIAPLLSLPLPEAFSVPTITSDERRRRTLNALTAIVDAHTAQGPLLIIAEDLHWVDPTTLELLDRILDRARDRPLLMVLTFRPEFAPAWATHSHVTMLALNHLTRIESRALIRNLGQSLALSDDAVEQVVERTDGIPLFIEELARSLVESGESTARIPETLRDALTARLDRLGPAKEVAQLASVIGRQFSRSAVAALFDGSETQLDEAIGSLLASGLAHRHRTSTGGDYEFKHALIRDTAYESLLKRRRHLLHGRLLAHFEREAATPDEAPLELLAHHACEAQAWRKSFDYARQAGSRAAFRGANAEALTLFDIAFESATHLPPGDELTREMVSIRIELRSPLHALGHNERLLVELTTALEAAEALGDRRAATVLNTYLSNFYRHRGDVQDGLDAAERAHKVAQELNDRTLVICSAFDLAQAERVTGLLHRCIETSERGLALIMAGEAGERFGRPASASVLLRFLKAEVLAHLGKLGDARDEALTTITLAESLGDQFGRTAANWAMSVAEYWRGDLRSAAQHLEVMRDIVQRERLLIWSGQPGWLLSELYARNGRGEEALTLCRASIETNRGLGYGNVTGRLFVTLGFIYKALGRQDEAEQKVREGVELARGKDVALEAWCGWIAGQVIADPDEALRQLEHALVIAERLEMRPLAALCRVGMSRRHPGSEANPSLVELRALGMDGWAEMMG